MQSFRNFCVRTVGEEGDLDRLTFVGGQSRHREPKLLTSLLSGDHLLRRQLHRLGDDDLLRAAIDALLALLEPPAIDRARARLIHDPPEHRAALLLIRGRPSPDVMKDVERELFGGFAARYD